MRTEMCQISPIGGQIIRKLDVSFPARRDTFRWPTCNEPPRRMALVLKWYIEDILLGDHKCCEKSPYKLNIFIEFVEDYDISWKQCRIENLYLMEKKERKSCKENTDSELDNERSTGEDEKENMPPVFYRNRLPNGTPNVPKMWHAPPDLPGHDARFLVLVCRRWWTIHFATFHHVHIFYRSQGDDKMSITHHGGYRLGNNKSTHTWNVHHTDV